uniref:Uncharacterized protein n=1 Tax=Sus scrofa TaxID=9823 RepID=A0A8D1WD08_PIG
KRKKKNKKSKCSGSSHCAQVVSMMHYKTSNSRRSCRKRYCENSSIVKKITKVYRDLFEKPEKAHSKLSYLKHQLSDETPKNPDIVLLRISAASLLQKTNAIPKENKRMKIKLTEYGKPSIMKRVE